MAATSTGSTPGDSVSKGFPRNCDGGRLREEGAPLSAPDLFALIPVDAGAGLGLL